MHLITLHLNNTKNWVSPCWLYSLVFIWSILIILSFNSDLDASKAICRQRLTFCEGKTEVDSGDIHSGQENCLAFKLEVPFEDWVKFMLDWVKFMKRLNIRTSCLLLQKENIQFWSLVLGFRSWTILSGRKSKTPAHLFSEERRSIRPPTIIIWTLEATVRSAKLSWKCHVTQSQQLMVQCCCSVLSHI